MWLSVCRLNATQLNSGTYVLDKMGTTFKVASICAGQNSGTYALVLHLPEAKAISVGRLGTIHFPAGYYVYVGSALRNLSSRIQRHLSLTKKLHWHIDYFREAAEVVGVFMICQPIRYECALAGEIARIADDAIPRFGSSDCRCQTHLHYFHQNPIAQNRFVKIFLIFRS